MSIGGGVETAVSTGDRVETAVSCEPQCYNCGTSVVETVVSAGGRVE